MTDALTRLADAVETGTATDADFDATWPRAMNGEHHYAKTAFHGSLDAAKALHEAVLPGWDWSVDNIGRSQFCAYVYDGSKSIGAFKPDPARAWLLAIIRAMAQVQK